VLEPVTIECIAVAKVVLSNSPHREGCSIMECR
jgi:hypothetical protein